MRYEIDKNDIILYEKDLDLAQTLDCGQAFRFYKCENGFKGFAGDNFLHINDEKNYFRLKNVSEYDFLHFFVNYFDLNTDYSLLKARFSNDLTLKKACEFAGGIRLLRQNSWEALCSFIISQNNNIKRIKGIIERLCECFGEKKEYGFAFPKADKLATLTVEDLSPLRAGFRAKYILDASKKVASGEIDLEMLEKSDYIYAKSELLKIVGVGEKVANCALLYGMYKIEAFPVDVWIRRVLDEYYPDGLPRCIDGFEGIAQQFLFHYIRNGVS